MTEVTRSKKPVWMVLQIAWSGVVKEGKTLRFPTFAEERYMTDQAIVNGARGVIYFGGHIEKAMSPADAKLGWNWTFWNRVLRPVVHEGHRGLVHDSLQEANGAAVRRFSRSEGARPARHARSRRHSRLPRFRMRAIRTSSTTQPIPPPTCKARASPETGILWPPATRRTSSKSRPT